jgi:radical SAM protein with 4Fe4S-binding SPASM domain
MVNKLLEGIHVLQKLTISKLWNILLLRFSYYLSTGIKKDIHWGKPFALSIEPTTSCNLRCPECPSGLRSFTRPIGSIEFDFYKSIIKKSRSFLSYLILYFQGEPFLNKNFFDLVSYASENGIYTVTSTNAHFLDDLNAKKTILSGLDKIIISLDGADQETYERYRVGGSFEKVINGIQNLVFWKKKLKKSKPLIVLQFLIMKTNQHQLRYIKKLSRNLKADQLAIKTAQVYNLNKGSEIIPDNEKMSRYKKINGSYIIKNKLENKCWRMWSSSVITWDGRMVPCCFDKDAKYVYGNLKESQFNEIWNGKNHLHFRKKVLSSRKSIDICQNCTEGSNIWAN